MKLYVQDVVREPNDSLYKFLSKVFKLNNGYFEKYTTNNTYYDSEFKKLQCYSNKYRSFDDIVLISKTYFRVSDKAVAKVIKKFLDKNEKISFVLCPTAKKWVLNINLIKSERIKYCFRYDKSDFKTDEYMDGDYSFDDIITLMGLTKEDVKINN